MPASPPQEIKTPRKNLDFDDERIATESNHVLSVSQAVQPAQAAAFQATPDQVSHNESMEYATGAATQQLYSAVVGQEQELHASPTDSAAVAEKAALKAEEQARGRDAQKIQSLKTMVVALSQKLKSKEASERQLEAVKQLLDEANKSKQELNQHLESLSQQMLVQVQSNRDSCLALQRENAELKSELCQANQDAQAMKSLLQAAQQQITSDQSHIAQQEMEIQTIKQRNQIQEDRLVSKFSELQQIHEERLSHLKKENYEGISAMECKLLELIKERDVATEAREKAENDLKRVRADSQMKDCRISNLNEMLASKDDTIQNLQSENRTVTQRLEQMAAEKQKYMAKVETILSEQKELRVKDKNLFNQVAQARD